MWAHFIALLLAITESNCSSELKALSSAVGDVLFHQNDLKISSVLTEDCMHCNVIKETLLELEPTMYRPHNNFKDAEDLNYFLRQSNESTLVILQTLTFTIKSARAMSVNSWLVLLETDAEEDLIEVIQHYLNFNGVIDKLQLNSRVFFLDLNRSTLHEAYNIVPHSPSLVIKAVLGGLAQYPVSSIWKRRQNLENVQLRVSYVTYKPYCYPVNKEDRPSLDMLIHEIDGVQLTGINVDLLAALMKDMNFTVKLVELKGDHIFGILNPDTDIWTGVMGQIVSGEADFSITHLSVTKSRSEYVTFSSPLGLNVNRLFMRKPLQSLSFFTFLDVFDPLFTAVFGLTVAVCTFVLAVCFFKGAFTSRIGHGSAVVLMASTALDASMFFPMEKMRISRKIIFLTICLFGALHFYIYNAGLTSSLTVEVFAIPVTRLRDLINNPNYQIMVLSGSADESYFSEATMQTNPNAKVVYDQQIKDTPKAYYDTNDEAEFKLMQSDSNILFVNEELVELSFKSYPCLLMKTKNTYAKDSNALPFTKDSSLVSLFNERILILRQAGIYQRMVHRGKLHKQLMNCSEEGFKPYSYHNIISAFLILLAGVSLAGISLFIEVLIREKKKTFY